ncbi:hypothetical protein GLYMA_16G115000v4 [Glycine max]|nr:hypothetical protein GLYMA_16G115000v4 [Glycine max]
MTLVVGANLLNGSLSIYFLFIYIKLILLTSEIEKHEVLRKCSFLFFYDGFVFHLSGLKKSGISIFLIIGIMVVRFIISPILGILIVKAAYYWGFIGSYSLYQFVLMLQYALPPATIVGTVAQMLGNGESECSLIMIWTYFIATFSLTLWCTFFMWMLEV